MSRVGWRQLFETTSQAPDTPDNVLKLKSLSRRRLQQENLITSLKESRVLIINHVNMSINTVLMNHLPKAISTD